MGSNMKRLSIALNPKEQELVHGMIKAQEKEYTLGRFVKARLFDDNRLSPSMKAILRLEHTMSRMFTLLDKIERFNKEQGKLYTYYREQLEAQYKTLEKIKE